jgi:hypothetical protein
MRRVTAMATAFATVQTSRDGRIRTDGLVHPKHALSSKLSYIPMMLPRRDSNPQPDA